MTKYKKIFESLAQFDIVLTNSEIDDFEITLNKLGLEIIEVNSEEKAYAIAGQILNGHCVKGIEQHKIEQLADKIVAVLTQRSYEVV